MPGVYRDKQTGEYRYFIINEYEDRRKRDYDDRYNHRNPFGPRRPAWHPGPPPSPLVPQPSSPPPAADAGSVHWQPAPLPVGHNAPPAFDFEAFRAGVNNAYKSSEASDVLAVLTGAGESAGPYQGAFDRLVESLPTRVGENREFDAVFDTPDVNVMTHQQALDILTESTK